MDSAGSYTMFKTEVRDWIYSHFDNDSKILDVGAGSATYWLLLNGNEIHYKNMDAVEVYTPNIIDHKLNEKYKAVYNRNIIDFEYEPYDLIIFGDVLEHMSVEDAQKVLNYAYQNCKNFIVAVPYCYYQDANENAYEKHIQYDLTHEKVLERYPMLKLIYGDSNYGYYIKK